MKLKVNKNLLKQAGLTSFFFVLLVVFIGVFFKSDSTLAEISENIVATCAKDTARQNCYDNEIPKVLDQGVSFEESIEIIKLIQNQDSGYWFCHAVAHKLSSKEYYKNPDGWKDVMTRSPMGICSNGFLHGALQAHFSTEALSGTQIKELLPDLQAICEKRENWEPTPQQQSSCYHELGHLSMYLTHGDILEAAKVCGTVGIRPDGRNYLQTCHEGIFMQVFEPREPDDFELIYDIVPQKEKLTVCEKYSEGVEKGGCWKIGWVEKYKDFCNGFQGDLRFACFREAWVVKSDAIQNAPAVMDYCSYTNDSNENRKCYNKLFYALMSIFHLDTKRMEPICIGLPLKVKDQCFANTASRLIETDRRLIDESVQVCDEAAKLGVGDECYKELSHYAGFVFKRGSEEFNELCSSLPENWEKDCLGKN